MVITKKDLKSFEFRGLCLIPVETYPEMTSGFLQEILYIPNLECILDFADRLNLYVCYLSGSKGLVHKDDYLEYESSNTDPLFNRILAEQVYRFCLDMFVSKVYYMGLSSKKPYLDFLNMLRFYGIEVISPIMGIDKEVVPKILKIYK